jgi:hypothetical protein
MPTYVLVNKYSRVHCDVAALPDAEAHRNSKTSILLCLPHCLGSRILQAHEISEI